MLAKHMYSSSKETN